MYQDNWNDDYGPVIVRRLVYRAACKLEEDAKTDRHGFTDWNLAEMRRDICRDEGDYDTAEFWQEVFEYLMTLECVSEDVEIKIVDRGENHEYYQ